MFVGNTLERMLGAISLPHMCRMPLTACRRLQRDVPRVETLFDAELIGLRNFSDYLSVDTITASEF